MGRKKWMTPEMRKNYERKYWWTKRGIVLKTFNRISHKCKKADIKFNLTREYLMDIFPDDWICPVLKIKMQRIWEPNGHKGGKENHVSLDRIDPSKGYTIGNVQFMSTLANRMKSNANDKQLLIFADWINNNIPRS